MTRLSRLAADRSYQVCGRFCITYRSRRINLLLSLPSSPWLPLWWATNHPVAERERRYRGDSRCPVLSWPFATPGPLLPPLLPPFWSGLLPACVVRPDQTASSLRGGLVLLLLFGTSAPSEFRNGRPWIPLARPIKERPSCLLTPHTHLFATVSPPRRAQLRPARSISVLGAAELALFLLCHLRLRR